MASFRSKCACSLALVLIAATATGCASGDGLIAGPAKSEMVGAGSPFDIATTPSNAAAAGSDLVLVEAVERTAGRQRLVAVRFTGGTWGSLPPVPFDGYVEVASVGDTVAIGGVSCPDDECATGDLAFALLSADRSSWRQLEAPPAVGLSDQTEMSVDRSPQSVARFGVGGTAYVVDAAGDIRVEPAFPVIEGADGFLGCVTADTLIALPYGGITEKGANGAFTKMSLIDHVYTLKLTDQDLTWKSASPVPEGVTSRYGDLCLPDSVSIQSGDMAWVFSLSTQEWTHSLSNLTELTGSEVSRNGPDETAVAPDQRTIFMALGEKLLTKTGDGQWADAGQVASEVYATDSAVLAFDPGKGSFVEVWKG